MKIRSQVSSFRAVLGFLLIGSFLLSACGDQSELDLASQTVNEAYPGCSSAGVVPDPPAFPINVTWEPSRQDCDNWVRENNIVEHTGVGFIQANSDYEKSSLIVHSLQEGNVLEPEWMEFRMAQPTDADTGIRWMHRRNTF